MKRVLILVLFAFIPLMIASHAMGADWKEVKARDLKSMMDKGNVTVVFPLSKIEFNDLHIKGSVHIPMHELKAKLPKDKGRTLVFYCLGRR